VSRAGLARVLSLAMLLPALMAFPPAGAGATGPAFTTPGAAAPAYRVYFADSGDFGHLFRRKAATRGGAATQVSMIAKKWPP